MSRGTTTGLAIALFAIGCYGSAAQHAADSGTDADADTDTDTGSGSDADTDVDADTDTGADTESIAVADTESVSVVDIDHHYLWHTFWASSFESYADAIAVDAAGGVFLAGGSSSSWDGPEDQPPLHPHSGSVRDGFVLALGPDGEYQWHTFLGPSCWAAVIAAGGDGGAFVAGKANASWDGPGGESPLHAYTEGACNVFVLGLNADGGYLWHTFRAFGDLCSPLGIAVDGSGHLDLAIPTRTNNPFDPWSYSHDLNVFQLDGDGALLWSVQLEEALGGWLAIDGSGNLYLAGTSYGGIHGPEGQDPLQGYTTGSDNSVIFKLGPDGAYAWHTFYPTGTHESPGVGVDGSGGVFLSGPSGPEWTGPEGEEPIHAFEWDVGQDYVLKLDADGAYEWHTFHSRGIPYSNPVKIAAGTADSLYAAGSGGYSVGPDGEEPDHAHANGFDARILALGADGSYAWHTLYGADSQDYAYGIVPGGGGTLYVYGRSDSSWDGPYGQPPLHAHSEGTTADAFILKLTE
ncbi:MAG: hypothetical protein M0R80_09140 [Proteobacteria bacterium]|nr:hypothetical protein [Pseudomonadota bacterium]